MRHVTILAKIGGWKAHEWELKMKYMDGENDKEWIQKGDQFHDIDYIHVKKVFWYMKGIWKDTKVLTKIIVTENYLWLIHLLRLYYSTIRLKFEVDTKKNLLLTTALITTLLFYKFKGHLKVDTKKNSGHLIWQA